MSPYEIRSVYSFCGSVLVLAVLCQGQTLSLPYSSTAVEGGSFRLTCTVTRFPYTLGPLTFRYGNTVACHVDADDCFEIQSRPRFSCGAVSCGYGHTRMYFLDINDVSRQDDRDDWRCQYSYYDTTGGLTVNYPPSITSSFPSSYTVIEQKRFNIDCSTHTTPGQPPATRYEWTHPDGSITSVLDISSINRSQRGQYTCTAVNTLSPGRQGKDNATVDISVQYLDSPVLTVDKTEVQEYDTVVFICHVASYPTVQMTITHNDNNNVLVKETTNHKQVTISRAQCFHNGTYVCSVYNREINTTTTSSRSLSVMCFPRHVFRVRLNNFIEKDYNRAAFLIADFISNPTPNYTLYRYDETYSPVGSQTVHRVINTEFKTRLEINIINSRDYGIYAAVAQNSMGIKQSRFFLTPTSQVADTEHPHPVSRSYTMEAIFGSLVAVLVVVIIIGIVIILNRKGCVCTRPGTNGRIQQNGQQTQEDDRTYAAIGEAVESQPNTTYSGEAAESQPNTTYSGFEIRTPQHYSGLTLYGNIKDEATTEPTVYDRLQGKTPVTYESLELQACENTSHEIKDEATSEPTVYDGLQGKTPVTYESLELHAYGNTSYDKEEPTNTNTTVI